MMPRALSASARRPPPPPPANQVGAVTAAVRILRHLAETDERQGATQVARALALNTSTTFNILRTLVHLDFVVFDEETKTYRLGLGVIDLARGVLSQGGFLGAVQPHLEELARRHDVTVSLWRRTTDQHLVLIGAADGISVMRIHITVGQRLPLFIGASGRTMAAHSDVSDSKLRVAFMRLRWEQPISFDRYRDEVREVKARGYAIDDGCYMRGVTSVAAPVLNPAGEAVMSLGSHFFKGQKRPGEIDRIAADTVELAPLVRRASVTGGFG